MIGLWGLLRDNRNYRYAWIGQVVSETGDWFNNIAVFALAMERSGSGGVVSAVNIARLIPVMIAGPVAGVILDRFDRKRIMIVSDLIRAAVAMGVGQLQWNVVTAERLRQAQQDPERYGNLPVRVAGFSQKFKLVDRELQEHIIARTKHSR